MVISEISNRTAAGPITLIIDTLLGERIAKRIVGSWALPNADQRIRVPIENRIDATYLHADVQ